MYNQTYTFHLIERIEFEESQMVQNKLYTLIKFLVIGHLFKYAHNIIMIIYKIMNKTNKLLQYNLQNRKLLSKTSSAVLHSLDPQFYSTPQHKIMNFKTHSVLQSHKFVA
jgi:hypothetical protein